MAEDRQRSMRPVRVGDTVRRPPGPWTSAVHALLRHLESVGFAGAPRVLGFDDDGREVLSYIEGVDSHHARDGALHNDQSLAAVARLLREFHEAAADFEPSADAVWRTLDGAPTSGPVCHNDIAPVNTIFRDGMPVAFIDWEYAAPAPKLWDVACAVWAFVPLADDDFCREYGYPLDDRGARIAVFCNAYGLDCDDRNALLNTIRSRELAMLDTIRKRARLGGPENAGYAHVWRTTRGQRWRDAVRYLDEHRGEWRTHMG